MPLQDTDPTPSFGGFGLIRNAALPRPSDRQPSITTRKDLVRLTVPVAGGDATSAGAICAVERLRQDYTRVAHRHAQAKQQPCGPYCVETQHASW